MPIVVSFSVIGRSHLGNPGLDSLTSSISADGRYVAFHSDASNLVPGDTNGLVDIFVHDRDTGTTERVSVSSGGTQGNAESENPSISADGRYVAFDSNSNNLHPADPDFDADTYVTTARQA